MPTFADLVSVAAENTLHTAKTLDVTRLRSGTGKRLTIELQSLNRLQQQAEANPEEKLVLLDRIQRTCMDELIAQKQPQKPDINWYHLVNLSRQTYAFVQNIVAHPDYTPPRDYP